MTSAKNYRSVSNYLLEAKVNVMEADYCGSKSGYEIGPGYFEGE